jgi:hypothetical protein
LISVPPTYPFYMMLYKMEPTAIRKTDGPGCVMEILS